jgi:hypothetical protein
LKLFLKTPASQPDEPTADITELLHAVADGGEGARDALYQVVYAVDAHIKLTP